MAVEGDFSTKKKGTNILDRTFQGKDCKGIDVTCESEKIKRI